MSEKTYTEEEAAHIAARRGLPRFVKLALRQEGLSKTSQEVSAMTVSHGKPYAGKPHVRFDEGAGVPGKGRPALLHELEWWSSGAAVVDCGNSRGDMV